jgi:hypothetical protein
LSCAITSSKTFTKSPKKWIIKEYRVGIDILNISCNPNQSSQVNVCLKILQELFLSQTNHSNPCKISAMFHAHYVSDQLHSNSGKSTQFHHSNATEET